MGMEDLFLKLMNHLRFLNALMMIDVNVTTAATPAMIQYNPRSPKAPDGGEPRGTLVEVSSNVKFRQMLPK